MYIEPHSQIHYSVTFEVKSKHGATATVNKLLGILLFWLQKRRGSFGGLDFSLLLTHLDGRCDYEYIFDDNNMLIVNFNSNNFFENIVVKYIHGDSNFYLQNWRIWRSDISINVINDKVYFSLLTTYKMRSNYIGEVPGLPPRTTPSIVSRILQNHELTCYSDSVKLNCNPRIIRIDDVQGFTKMIEDSDRVLPIILVSLDPLSSMPLIDVNNLQHKLLGNANIFIPGDRDVEMVMQYYWPFTDKNYQCYNGAVRIYFGNILRDDKRDYLRHRFFNPSYVKEYGEANVIGQMVDGLLRSSRLHNMFDDGSFIYTIEDLNILKSNTRVHDKINGYSLEEARELLKYYENEIDKLNRINRSFDKFMGRFENEIFDLKYNLEYSNEINSKLENKNFYLETIIAEMRQENIDLNKRLNSKLSFNDKIKNLPDDLPSLLDFFGDLYSDRIIVLDSAKRHARNSEFFNMKISWEILWHFCNTLYDLYYLNRSKKIDLDFRKISGYELALSESSTTQDNPKLMKDRHTHYNGISVYFVSHIKAKLKKDYFRLYYHSLIDEQKLLIGFCGDHMDTAGTSRRS